MAGVRCPDEARLFAPVQRQRVSAERLGPERFFESLLKALGTLTSTQRINLIIDVYHGWDSEDDEETAWKLLETAPDTDARRVIKYIGWDDLVGFFDGVEDTKFRQRFPETVYR